METTSSGELRLRTLHGSSHNVPSVSTKVLQIGGDDSEGACKASTSTSISSNNCFVGNEGPEKRGELRFKPWRRWQLCHFHNLPEWMQDNDFLLSGHRPPMPSFYECFASVFRLHSETGNIWSHLLGALAFTIIAIQFLTRPPKQIGLEDKLVFGVFFACAVFCLGMSTVSHAVQCHSERVAKLFAKLDYCGIAVLIIGSVIPCLHYGFYCRERLRVLYLSATIILGLLSIIVSLFDRFGEAQYRPIRAGLFMAFGLSGAIPAFHYALSEGWHKAMYHFSLGWLVLMGVLYIAGAFVYALRIPERFFPGRCDIWFQSHQIFHLFVIGAALVHYHGLIEMAIHRSEAGECGSKNSVENM